MVIPCWIAGIDPYAMTEARVRPWQCLVRWTASRKTSTDYMFQHWVDHPNLGSLKNEKPQKSTAEFSTTKMKKQMEKLSGTHPFFGGGYGGRLHLFCWNPPAIFPSQNSSHASFVAFAISYLCILHSSSCVNEILPTWSNSKSSREICWIHGKWPDQIAKSTPPKTNMHTQK